MAGEAAADAESQPGNIAVVDAGGNLVARVWVDGAWLGSVDNSTNKAVANRSLPTAATRLGERVASGKQFSDTHASTGGSSEQNLQLSQTGAAGS